MFKNVYEINLASCRLQDVSAFTAFDSLTYLDVSDNYICDISPLQCFHGNYLDISTNPLYLGTRQNYAVKSIRRFMNDNPCRYSEITFLCDDIGAVDSKSYQKAQSLCAPTLTAARSAAQAALEVTTAPADANVAAACLFMADNQIVKSNRFTGALTWTPASILETSTVPITVTPVSEFASFTAKVQILCPEIVEFTYNGGIFTLIANKATETVRIGTLSLSSYTQSGEYRFFEVPAYLEYSDTLTAVPSDNIGDGSAAAAGTKPQENASSAKVLSFTSDKAAYRTGDTAVLTVRTDSAANAVKIKDSVRNNEIISFAFTQADDAHIFTFRVPVTAESSFKYKAYASKDDTFFIGAKVLTFTSCQAATDITLSSDGGNTLYFCDGSDSLQLNTSIYPESAMENTTITLCSANTQVARVEQDGTVSAVGYGNTVVTATSDNGVQTSFPVFVDAPKMSPVEVSEGNYNEVSYLECYTKGASEIVLKNADGSDVDFYYESDSEASSIDGYDTYHIFALYTLSPEPLALRVYALDRNGMNENSRYTTVNLTPTVPVESFSFDRSAYSFDRNGGAVTISLNVLPAGADEYFNWAISNNTIATLKGYTDYCVLTPKKSGTVRLTASLMIGGEEVQKSVNVTFSEGKIYSATLETDTAHCFEPIEVEVVTDTTVQYLNLKDMNSGLSEEFASYTFFKDDEGKRTWHVPFAFKRESQNLQITGGDSLGNLSSSILKTVNITLPEENFAANPALVKGNAGSTAVFHLISLPGRTNLPFSAYTVTSQDPDIASFNLGTLYLKKEGETTLHCVYGEEQKDVRVIISNPIESISFPESVLTLNEEELYTLQLTAVPDSREPIAYRSSDPGIASVSESGLVTAVHEGTAVITACSAGGVKATVTIKVKGIQEITTLQFEKEHYTVHMGESINCSLLSNVASLQNKLTFFTSNTNIVSVGENGTFTALKEGTVTISALSDSGITACAALTVTANRVLALSRESIQATVKDFILIMPLISPEGADVDGVWYSDNEAVATITQGGYLSAKSPGKCNIIFITNRGEIATCMVEVYSTNASKLVLTDKELNYWKTKNAELTRS